MKINEQTEKSFSKLWHKNSLFHKCIIFPHYLILIATLFESENEERIPYVELKSKCKL
jgi:hypothetical protein